MQRGWRGWGGEDLVSGDGGQFLGSRTTKARRGDCVQRSQSMCVVYVVTWLVMYNGGLCYVMCFTLGTLCGGRYRIVR